MKINASHIQFIDKYLEDKGVYYIDIRQELTDHIATELEQKEGDFRENFTAYRAVNERNLLKQSKKLYTLSLYTALTYFIKKIQRPVNAVLFIGLYILCNYSIKNVLPQDIRYSAYTIHFFPALFLLLNRYTQKYSVPKNILHGLACLFLGSTLLIMIASIFINNTIITDIITRYIASFLIAVTPVAIASALRYKNYNLRLN